MGPIATGLGEIYLFEVKNAPDSPHPHSLMELRTILDWEVARPLKSVPGVIEVNALGGELKTFQVRLDPERLSARGIAVNRVFEAVRRNNANAGGGYTQRNGEIRVIRGVGLIDVEYGPPVDTFAGAGGEEKARRFGTYGYSIRARKPA
jgi:cobalt-zinc-cadmium resistance protein CzcA